MATVPLTAALRGEYAALFDTCQIREERAADVNRLVKTILSARDRYEALGRSLTIPWYLVAVIHALEASCNFKCHLHNGDPLNARTVQEPPNRPVSGTPPFTWEASAEDARDYLGRIRVASRSMHSLLDNAMTATRSEAQRD